MGRQRLLDDFGTVGPSSRRDDVRPTDAGPSRPVPGGLARLPGHVEHPFLAPGVVRALPFQLDLARIGLDEDLLVVLPTGLGKTVIAALFAAEILRRSSGKILFLAPTRPLVQQHADSFARWLSPMRSARFTGTVRRPLREGSWETADLVFATPEIVQNDLAGRSLPARGGRAHRLRRSAPCGRKVRLRADRGAVSGGTTSGRTGPRSDRVARWKGRADRGGGRGSRRPADRGALPRGPGVVEYVQPTEVELRWVDLPPSRPASARCSRAPRTRPRASSRRWATCGRSRSARSRSKT